MLFGSDVLCIGSVTLDTFLKVERSLAKIKLGDKVLVSSLEKHSGGGATNAAVALTKFGLKARILTKLGRDHDGEFIQKELRQHKVENICLHHSHRCTDSASIIDYSRDKDRIIYVHKGASEDLKESDFKVADLKSKWLYLATLTGKSWKTAERIAHLAWEKHLPILFNPSLYLAQKGKTYLKPVLGVSFILVLNREEALALLGKKKGQPQKLLRALQKLGPEIVIITDGPRRLYARHSQEIFSLQPPQVRIVHTAGAGDAFTAAFLGAYIKNYSFEDCLRLGQANACSVIQAKGVKHKLLTEKEAWNVISKYKIKVRKERR
ncbi:MAG: carbohydrate kinase family protein [Candidatus Woesearchaeota archaeon]